MDKVLKLVKEIYQDSLIDIALLKDILYKVVDKNNVSIVQEFIEKGLAEVKVASKDIAKSTNAETFLKNLVKDKSK